MLRFHDFGVQINRAGDRRIEIIELEPKQYPVAIGLRVAVADRTVMVFNVPVVKLHDQPPIANQAFVMRSAVGALDIQKLLIPTASGLNVADADQRLRGRMEAWGNDLLRHHRSS
jgi:hypothetical protein